MARRKRNPNHSSEKIRYEIVLAPDAVNDLNKLRAFDRRQVRDGLETHLRHQPTPVSKSRIKRLRGLKKPQFRLRIGEDIRVFYDVHESNVEVLAVLSKDQVEEWLEKEGVVE
jgi:mRNA-degrading endonuclease RelE of RelBE toxin-antitoxin system